MNYYFIFYFVVVVVSLVSCFACQTEFICFDSIRFSDEDNDEFIQTMEHVGRQCVPNGTQDLPFGMHFRR